MQKFDVFIPIAPKDLFRLKLVLKYLILNVHDINNIHICTPSPIDKIEGYNVKYHLDSDILPYVTPQRWKFRPNWILQQFLKLFQNVTSTDYFLTLDSDTIIAKKLNFFENKKPVWFYGKDQDEQQYHKFNKRMFNLEKLANHTYIGDMGFFNKTIIQSFVDYTKRSVNDIIEESYGIISHDCHISEFELYGNFVEKYYTDFYKTKQLKSLVRGKFQNNPYTTNWERDEVKQLIQEGISGGYDVVNMHSWCIASHAWNDNKIQLS